MKSTKNFFRKSKELIDRLEIMVSIGGEYVRVDYGTARFRLGKDTSIRSLKQMLNVHNYNENDVCIMCAFMLNEICLSEYLDPIVKVDDELTIIGGGVLQSDKAGDFKIDLEERIFITDTMITVREKSDEDMDTDGGEEEYKFYLEQLSKYIKIAITDKYTFLMELVGILIDCNEMY